MADRKYREKPSIHIPTVLVKEGIEGHFVWTTQQNLAQQLEKDGLMSECAAESAISSCLSLKSPLMKVTNADRMLVSLDRHYLLWGWPHLPGFKQASQKMVSEYLYPKFAKRKAHLPTKAKLRIATVAHELMEITDFFRCWGVLPAYESPDALEVMGASLHQTVSQTKWWKDRLSSLADDHQPSRKLKRMSSTGMGRSGKERDLADLARICGRTLTFTSSTYEGGVNTLTGHQESRSSTKGSQKPPSPLEQELLAEIESYSVVGE